MSEEIKRGYGVTRSVLLTRKYAIKVPQFRYEWKHFLQGLLANMQEVNFSRMKDERMCPVIFHLWGGWLLVMPRCKPLTRQEFFDMDYEEFENGDFKVPVENKLDSFGWHKGRIVAVDYGS